MGKINSTELDLIKTNMLHVYTHGSWEDLEPIVDAIFMLVSELSEENERLKLAAIEDLYSDVSIDA